LPPQIKELSELFDRASGFCQQASKLAKKVIALRQEAAKLENSIDPNANVEKAAKLRADAEKARRESHDNLSQFVRTEKEIGFCLLTFGEPGRPFREAMGRLNFSIFGPPGRIDFDDDIGIANGCFEFANLSKRALQTLSPPAESAAPPTSPARAANARRDYDASMFSATAETATHRFKAWAGASRSTLAFVFTDVVGSTALGSELGDERMNETRRAHFRQVRSLVKKHRGKAIKTIGDAFMVAFRTAVEALNFALELSSHTGHESVRIRAAVHVGPVRIEEEDAFGSAVNFAARVGSLAKGAEIWISDRAKRDIDLEKAAAHEGLRWKKRPGCDLKGIPGEQTLWSLKATSKPSVRRSSSRR
jgi:class 3 adenylate cyclase